MYKISVILPVFNVGEYIERAFDSLLNQTIGFENLEIIFVDDCSTDNSALVIQKLVNQYNNVKYFHLDENSGAAGKPRNVGIQNSNSKYLMFLDPDDVYVEDACEQLYNHIINDDLDLVSGNYVKLIGNQLIKNNWGIFRLKDNKIKFNSVYESPEILRVDPLSVAKIYKKDIIVENNIKFPEGVPAEDLYFVAHYILNSKGILFLDVPIIKYIFREGSVTNKRDKKTLSNYIKVYNDLTDLLKSYDENLAWLPALNLNFWSKIFVLSRLGIEDKIDLLRHAYKLYVQVKESPNLAYKEGYELFYEKVCDKDFYGAVKEADKVYLKLNEGTIDFIKSKDIFMIFFGFELEIGGLAKAVFNRANMLAENGYNITLLNIDSFRNDNIFDDFKNFRFIESFYKKIGLLNNSVNFINMFDYFSDKNTSDFSKKFYSEDYLNITNGLDKNINLLDFNLKLEDNFFIYDDYIVERKVTRDHQIILYYYNKEDLKDEICSVYNLDKLIFIKNFSNSKNNIPIKSEAYIDESLIVERFYKKEEVKLYTVDGFNYCSINKLNDELLFKLNDCHSSCSYDLSYKEFYEYFTLLICLESHSKPFLINDCPSGRPSIGNISSELAFKISNIHCNHHRYPFNLGSDISPLGAFENIDDLDALVVLTKSQKNDFKKEFDFDKVYDIPNFIPNTDFDEMNSEKNEFNHNKISVFSRIDPSKNIYDIIIAFKKVVELRPNAILEIFGRSLREHEIREYNRLMELIKELGLQNNVFFKGHVNNVNEEMANSVATIFTSKTEGLGLVVIESMANSTPVISYDLNYGPSDIINNNENGFLIEEHNIEGLSEKMLYFLDNPSKSVEMGKLARKKIIKNFSEETIFEKWEGLFKRVYIDDTDVNEHSNGDCSSNSTSLENPPMDIKLLTENTNLINENIRLKLNLTTLEKEVMKLKNDLISTQSNNNSWKIFKRNKS